MFEIPKNFEELVKGAQEMQKKVGELKEQAESKVAEASAGGGMVSVKVNGAQRVLSIKIDPTVVNSSDLEMLEDLVCAAVNEGIRKSKEILSEDLKKLTGGVPLPF